MKRSAFLLSRLLRQAPEVAISTNYKALSANLLQCQSLRQRGCYLDEQFGDFRSLVKKPSGIVVRTPSGSQIPLGKLSRDDLDIEKEKNRLLFGLVEQEVADVRSGEQMELFGAPKTKKTKKVVDPDLRQRLKTKTVTNKQAELVYLTPFVRAMYPFIDDHPYAREIIKEIADTPDTRIGRVNKLMLAQGLQRHYLGLRTHTALNFSPTRGHQKIPRQEYHPEAFIFEKLYNIRLEDINNHIADAKEQFQDAVKRFNIEIIDSATYTAITLPQEHRQKFIDWLHQERMGIYAGQAQVVSPSQSARFLFYQNGIVFGQGIDINFSRGLKNEYDKQVMDSILDAVFEKEDIGMVVDIVARSVADLRSGKVAFEQLLYVTTECKKDPEQYSARALKNRDTWEKIRAGVKKGDRFAWGYTHQGEKSMSDINQEDIDTDIYTRMMFGEKRKERWNFRTYQRSAEKRSRTTCGAIVESLLVYNTDEKELQEQKHRALARVVTDSQQGDEKAILTLS